MKRLYLTKKLSKRLNYLKESVVLEFYYALMDIVIEDLKTKGEFEFPDFGKFTIKEHKGRRMMDVRSREMKNLPPIKTVKFSAHRKLKDFFKNLSQSE